MPQLVSIAAIFCRPGDLDRILDRGILPAHLTFLNRWGDAGHFSYLRYARRGEQWKLRLSITEEAAGECRDWLFETFRGLEAAEPDRAEPEYLAPFDRLPLIDAEDRGQGLRTERGIFPATPQINPVVFGPERFLGDPQYLESMSAAQGASCKWLALHGIARAPGGIAAASPAQRLQVFLPWVVELLGHSGLSLADLREYSLYHRDTLLRYLLAFNEVEDEKQAETMERLAGHAARSAAVIAAAKEGLVKYVSRKEGREESLHSTLASLLSIARDPAKEWAQLRIDPYTSRNEFLPLFKLINLAANILGLTKLNEAAVLHLAAHACGATPEELSSLAIYPVLTEAAIGVHA